MVRKSDGTLRFCVDYRQLNERTVRDAYPLPRIDVCLDALADASWFSTFDLRSGYHQVEMDPRDSDKTTFVTKRRSFRFKVMPIGLCNAQLPFKDLSMLRSQVWIPSCLGYLDVIIVHSRDIGLHLARLRELFERLQGAGLKLKISKCRLLQREVVFLGHRVSAEGLSMDPGKIGAIREWPMPRCLREARSFLGLCSYYRKFVPDFSEIAAPLHALTRKNVRYLWSLDCQKAFEELKRRLISSPVLALPRDDGEYILDTDVSESVVGAVLSQVQEGEERPVAYFSCLYSRTETNYCTTRKELLAVVEALRQY